MKTGMTLPQEGNDSGPASAAGHPFRPHPALAAATVVGLFLAAAAPLLLSGYNGGRGGYDSLQYHLPAIESLARQWPRPDFLHFSSATTPGYHLVLALVRRYAVVGVRGLRTAGALFTVGWLAAQAADAGRRLRLGTAVAVCLPLVCSPYIFDSGAWVLPDNAAWWAVLCLMLLVLRPKIDRLFYIAGSVALLAVVLVRQLDIWCAAVLVAAAWLGPAEQTAGCGSRKGEADPIGRAARPTRLLLALVAVVPAALALGGFYRLWRGPVPPDFRQFNAAGANPAVPAMVLSVFGILGAFYAGFLLPRLAEIRRAWPLLTIVALLGLLAGSLPRTSYDMDAGRWSGIWNLTRHLPTFANRSPLMIATSTFGGLMLAAWAVALPRRHRWIFLTAWAAFVAANSASHEAFQRYYEPFALMMLALCAPRVSGIAINRDGTAVETDPSPLAWAMAGPVVLAAFLTVLTVLNVRQPSQRGFQNGSACGILSKRFPGLQA